MDPRKIGQKSLTMKNVVVVTYPSPYGKDRSIVPLPKRMGLATPDTKTAWDNVSAKVEARGGRVIFTDFYRTHDMQHQAHLDYVNGKKESYSPPAGQGVHEAARAGDVVVQELKMSLKDFWAICAEEGIVPIIKKPELVSECWHYEKRGSHQTVYNYYKLGKGNNMGAYQAMAISAILAIGNNVDESEIGDQDFLKGRNTEAFIQSCLIRLGNEIGNLDGVIGERSRKALLVHGIDYSIGPEAASEAIENIVRKAYPNEFTPV